MLQIGVDLRVVFRYNGLEKRPHKSTPIGRILHMEIQTYPQLPRGMQRIRGPFVLVTVLTYVDRPFVQ